MKDLCELSPNMKYESLTRSERGLKSHFNFHYLQQCQKNIVACARRKTTNTPHPQDPTPQKYMAPGPLSPKLTRPVRRFSAIFNIFWETPLSQSFGTGGGHQESGVGPHYIQRPRPSFRPGGVVFSENPNFESRMWKTITCNQCVLDIF